MKNASIHSWVGIGETDIGKVRSMNQDAFAIRNDLQLWVLADGMGGHAGGEVASRMAVDLIPKYVESHPPYSQGKVGPEDIRAYEHLLVDAIEDANQLIREEAQRTVSLKGMGTTVLAVRILSNTGGRDHALVCHAGDSRLYLFRRGRLTLWTRDHTLMEERLALNLITPDQVATHPLRHVLTKALGPDQKVLPACTSYLLEEGDLLLFCSDGLTKMLTDDEIQALLYRTGKEPEHICAECIRTANHLGGLDNTTVIVVGLGQTQGTQA
jgi:serine/threonine protein phosphatase PrpC